MIEFKIIIEGAPVSVNKTYSISNRSGRAAMYMNSEGKAYAQSAGYQAKAQRPGQKPLEQSLEVTYYFYFKDRRVRDHLNFNKCLNDSLNKIVWADDKQIQNSHHYTFIDKKNPRVELLIKEIERKNDV